MKRILSLILVLFSACFQLSAENPKSDAPSQPVVIKTHQTGIPDGPHRAPIRIDIEAYYNAECQTIDICYEGGAYGEVFLYRDNELIGYDSQINTSFQISAAPALYTVEIVGESWTATGRLQL